MKQRTSVNVRIGLSEKTQVCNDCKNLMKEINQTTLLDLAGEAAYRRGEPYYHNNQVGELRIKGNTITAEVTGNEIYLVKLKHTSKIFEGNCDCPASDNFDFCKHCVATGLKYLAQLQSSEQLYDSKAKDLLKNYLLTLEKSELAEKLEELITYDNLLQDEWMLKAEIAAGKLDHKSFKKRITKAIPYNRHLYRYAQVRTYFSRVGLVVDKLAELLPELKPDDALTLIDYALQRINKALGSIDDSGGFRFDSLETLSELHILTLARSHWPPEKIASYLLAIYSDPEDELYELYPAIPESYLDILSDEGLGHFIADLQSQWDKLPPLTGKVGKKVDWDRQWQYRRIQHPLLVAAKVRKDVDTQIELLAKTACTSHNLIDLSELCLNHDRLDEAIDWLRQAQQQDKREGGRYQNQSLFEQEIVILCYQQKFDQALKLRWADYQRHPHLKRYRKVCDMARQAGDNSNWYQKAVAHLQSKNKKDNKQLAYNFIAELHLYEQHHDLALDLAQQHKLRQDILLDIIRANADKQEQILPLYIRLAESEVKQGNNDAYHNAIDLLHEAEEVMNEALCKILFKEITRLQNQYKQKRNFKKWLEEAFPVLVKVTKAPQAGTLGL